MKIEPRTSLRPLAPIRLFAKSIRFRLVGLSVLIFGTTLIALAAYLYQGIENTQQSAFDTSLYNYAVDVAGATDFTALGDLVVRRDVLVEENKVFPFSLGQSLVQIRTMDGATIVSSKRLQGGRLPLSSETLAVLLRQGVAFETVRSSQLATGLRGSSFRLINYLIRKPSMPPLILQVAAPQELLENEKRQVLSLFWTLIPLALGAAALVGMTSATRALAPVNRIIKSAQAIGAQRLSERVPVPEETELRDLAITLNELLARLQQTFLSQDQFIADASHQLKTPLAIIRGEIDVFERSSSTRSPEEATQLLGSVSQEVNQLAKMVDDLLLLARFDSSKPVTLSRVRLDEVVLEAISQLSKPAHAKGVVIAFNVEENAPLEVNGDFDLLKHLFFNLIENAIKYSPAGSPVDVRLAPADVSETNVANEVQVDVIDRGRGIAAGELTKIFDRFYRSGSEQHRIPGVGLGLSIALRIAKFHGAVLTVESEPLVKTTFSFRIKKF